MKVGGINTKVIITSLGFMSLLILLTMSIYILLFASTAKAFPSSFPWPTSISGSEMRTICGANIDWLIRYDDTETPTARTTIHIYKAQGTFHTTGSTESLLVGASDLQAFINHHTSDHVGLALVTAPDSITYFTCRSGAGNYHHPELVPLREWLNLTISETELTAAGDHIDGEEDDCYSNVEWTIAFWNTAVDIAKCTFSVVQGIFNWFTNWDITEELQRQVQNFIAAIKDKLGGAGQIFDLMFTFINSDILGRSDTFNAGDTAEGQAATGYWGSIVNKNVRKSNIVTTSGIARGNTNINLGFALVDEACGANTRTASLAVPAYIKEVQGYSSRDTVRSMFVVESSANGKCEIKYNPVYHKEDNSLTSTALKIVPGYTIDWKNLRDATDHEGVQVKRAWWNFAVTFINASLLLGSFILIYKTTINVFKK